MHPYQRSVSWVGLSLALGLLLALPVEASHAASLSASEQALAQGRVDDAVSSLRGVLAGDSHNTSAHLLLCRAYLSEELADQAVSECEAAAAAAPGDSVTQDWLGRAYGLKAGRSGPFAGYSLAKKVRDAFEAAVRLNPRSGDAFDDLGEFYMEAPSLVGGGLDKASALAAQGAAIVPARARILRATIAEKEKDYGTAEREFLAETQNSARPDAWIDLGRFYGRRKQNDKAVAAIRHAIELDTAHDNSLAHAADALIKLNQEPQLAMESLRKYLSGSALSDAAPACKAHAALGKLLLAAGDKPAAKMEFQKAVALASGYAPARKELASL